MHMALRTRSWTRADIDRLPDDGNRYEVLEGELLVTPAPSRAHQEIVSWLAEKLAPFVLEQRLGRLYFPRSVVVTGESQLEPDLMVRPRGAGAAWESAPRPILVVEVLSPTTRRNDLTRKRAFYMAHGVTEYWIVDRDTRSVVSIRPGSAETLTRVLSWSPTGAAARLDLDLVAMFADAGPE